MGNRVNSESGIKSMLLALGILVTRRTKTEEVLGVIRKLRPQDCGIELIRIGGQGDGGYLIPNDLEGIEYCFSPGVSTVSSFENDLADLGIRSFLADYSVDGPAIIRPELVFDKKFLGSSDGGDFITLAAWKKKYIQDYKGDLILQMDIEGHEYSIILSTPESLLDQFRILAIEFHFIDRLFDRLSFGVISSTFDKLLQFFEIAHIHPNNAGGSIRIGEFEIPKVMEFTFINKRRVRSKKPQTVFPHRLDVENRSAKPIPLPKYWYASN